MRWILGGVQARSEARTKPRGSPCVYALQDGDANISGLLTLLLGCHKATLQPFQRWFVSCAAFWCVSIESGALRQCSRTRAADFKPFESLILKLAGLERHH